MHKGVPLLLCISMLGSIACVQDVPNRADARIDSDEQALRDFLAFRDAISAGNREAFKITTENGVDVIESLSINGLEQWFSIRGHDRENPVLLYLHAVCTFASPSLGAKFHDRPLGSARHGQDPLCKS